MTAESHLVNEDDLFHVPDAPEQLWQGPLKFTVDFHMLRWHDSLHVLDALELDAVSLVQPSKCLSADLLVGEFSVKK